MVNTKLNVKNNNDNNNNNNNNNPIVIYDKKYVKMKEREQHLPDYCL